MLKSLFRNVKSLFGLPNTVFLKQRFMPGKTPSHLKGQLFSFVLLAALICAFGRTQKTQTGADERRF